MAIEVDFWFQNTRDNGFLNNNTQYTIHHQLCAMLQDSGFGDIFLNDEGMLINAFARPFTLGFVGDDQRELHYGYMFAINNDVRQGNLGRLLTNGIQNFSNFMENNFPDVQVMIRTSYQHE